MSLELKGYINGLAGINSTGRFLSFSVFNIFHALELLSAETVGRNKLAEQLGVGEGVIRTILSRLCSAGLVQTSKTGCLLTDDGWYVWGEIEKIFPTRIEFPRTELTTSLYNYAFLVRRGDCKVGSGLEQRDAAIVAGALCAVVVLFNGGHLQINSVCDDAVEAFPHAATDMLQRLRPQEHDAIVLAGAATALKAMRGAFAASWSLLDSGLETFGTVIA